MLTRASRPRRLGWLLALPCALLALCRPNAAHASDTIIRYGRVPVGYTFELEPHLVVGSSPPGPGYGSGAGVGVRGSFVFAPQGFISGVNDSAAIGVGLDFGHYYGSLALNGYRDQCLQFEPGPNGTSICTEVTSNGGTYNYVFVPVVLQWNFWFTDRLSAFGEPGLDLYFLGSGGTGASPALYVGGRFRVTDRITITARLGYPTFGIGVSFLM
jgi:hypothetical protein